MIKRLWKTGVNIYVYQDVQDMLIDFLLFSNFIFLFFFVWYFCFGFGTFIILCRLNFNETYGIINIRTFLKNCYQNEVLKLKQWLCVEIGYSAKNKLKICGLFRSSWNKTFFFVSTMLWKQLLLLVFITSLSLVSFHSIMIIWISKYWHHM